MNRQELQFKCELAKPFLASGSLVPILNNICFTGDALHAYNDNQGISITLPTPITGGVPGVLLLKALGTMSTDTVQLQQKGAALTLKTGKALVELPLLAATEFVFAIPEFDQPPLTLAQPVIDGVKHCLRSVGANPAQLENNGVTWQLEHDKLTMYSTDGDTISRYQVDKRVAGIAAGDHYEVILPTMFCEQLVALVTKFLTADHTFRIDYDQEQLVARIGDDYRVYTRTIPNVSQLEFESTFEQHMPNQEALPWQPVTPAFREAIERAALISALTEIRAPTELTITGPRVSMFTRSSAGGHAMDELEFDAPVADQQLALFNPQYVRRVLDSVTQVAFLPTVLACANADFSYTYIVGYEERE